MKIPHWNQRWDLDRVRNYLNYGTRRPDDVHPARWRAMIKQAVKRGWYVHRS